MEPLSLPYLIAACIILLVIGIAIYNILRRKSAQGVIDLTEGISSTPEGNRKFWRIEYWKKHERSEILDQFRDKKEFTSPNYKVKSLDQLSGKNEVSSKKDHFDSIRSLHGIARLAKLKKLAKRPNPKFLNALLSSHASPHTQAQVSGQSDVDNRKRSRAFFKIKRFRKKFRLSEKNQQKSP